ncbi:MAG: hypothetical protein AAGU23_03995 [Bacillota bacterium]|nr:hypothetical protein [Bacillota bacterium]HWR56545.1 hypothetical protein [Negativicutes bacterium]
MPLANCIKCGKLYNKILHDLCPACIAEMEQDFEKVYAFLKENGPTHIDVIHEETGVEKKLIMKFLAEGRFEGVTVSYKCESCGASINKGKLCAKCTEDLNAQIQKMQQDASPRGQVKAQAYLGRSSLDRYRQRDK